MTVYVATSRKAVVKDRRDFSSKLGGGTPIQFRTGVGINLSSGGLDVSAEGPAATSEKALFPPISFHET